MPLRVDGALVDEFNLPHGFWEAKDRDDDLGKEIKAKFALGYPRRNIIFQSPDRAVIYQNGSRVLDCSINRQDDLAEAMRVFLGYEESSYDDWQKASAGFKERIAEHGRALAALLIKEKKRSPEFARVFDDFATLCRASINPTLSDAAVEEMLVQHILTWRIFKGVFGIGDFMQKNVIAQEIEKVVLAIRAFSREDFLKSLDKFYVALEEAAARIPDFSEKQKFLNTVYERFFQGFAVKQADTLGIVYTPQPIVDFMVASVDRLLKTEFGKSDGLGAKAVHILDGFTGTGNFIVNIMRHLAATKKSTLPQKYAEELHCNEVMLLPYYVASMNIEHEYLEAVGDYKPFEGICLVDTFETVESSQTELGFMNEANSQRVQRQKRTPIYVCIGNPPYNAWQVNENDNNRNRKYPVIDQRVRETYGEDSTAQNRNSLADPYIKAFRWASDRIIANGEGIVAFVSNNAFLDSLATDGMRAHLEKDFDLIYVADLGGNVRKNPKLSGTTHNVFGIQVGVSINLLVRLPRAEETRKRKAKIFYHAVPLAWRRTEKYEWLEEMENFQKVKWSAVSPDKQHNWIQSGLREEFETFLPLGDRNALGNNSPTPPIFAHYSRGVATSRDAWAVNFQREAVAANMERTIEAYNAEVERWHRAKKKPEKLENFIDFDSAKIAWSRDLKNDLLRHRTVDFEEAKARPSLYRPFTKSYLFFDRVMNEEVYGFPETFPTPDSENLCICVTDAGSEKPFLVLIADRIADLHLVGAGASTQCFPFYTYNDDGSHRRENIPLSALIRFQSHYGDDRITKWDIFHYVYALLHHRGYRERFAANLKRELPRIPLAPEFRAFARAGKKLTELHVHYEEQAEYPLKAVENKDAPLSWRVDLKMKLTSDKRAIVYNNFLTLEGIPPEVFDYRLGNRSALEWVIDQYQVSVDQRSGIENDPNRSDDDRYIVRLIGQVITVSLETLKIVKTLPADFGGTNAAPSTRKELREWRMSQTHWMTSEEGREQREALERSLILQETSIPTGSESYSSRGRGKKS